MPRVNPEILVWARETAGLTPEQAAQKLQFRDTRKATAVNKLAALESGQAEPTRPVLVRMAQQYRRPLLTFYLSKPPSKGDRGADFRTLPAGHSAADDALLDALLRDVRARQSMVRAVLEDEDEAEPLHFVGSRIISDGQPAVLKSLQDLLDVGLKEYRGQPDAAAGFNLLRSRAESAGVFVLLKGDLGNHQTAIDLNIFRGFTISDTVAPFIVINPHNSRPEWSFTLLHELVHLFLGQTGVSGEYAGNEVERFCNNVASEFLLPSDEIGRPDDDFPQDRLQKRAAPRERTGQQDGSPGYDLQLYRLGNRLPGLVRRMMASGALTTSKAAQILGVKPGKVHRLFENDERA